MATPRTFGMFDALATDEKLIDIVTKPTEQKADDVEKKLAELFGINFYFDPGQPQRCCEIECNPILITQIALLISSLPAGILYLEYAEKCLDINFCEAPVSFLSDKELEKYLLLFSGGSGFSLSAAKLGFAAAPTLYYTFKEQDSRSAKMMIFYCLIYVVLQSSREVISALGGLGPNESPTDTKALMTLLFPPLAVIATALYNASKTYPHVRSTLAGIMAHVLDACRINSPEEIAKRKHNTKEHKKFIQLVDKRWQQVLQHPEALDTHDKNQLRSLLTSELPPLPEKNNCRRALGYSVGALGSTAMLAGGTWNTYMQLGKFLPFGGQAFLTGLLTIISVPALYKMPAGYFANSDKLAWYFHPKKTAATILLSTFWQMFSHSAIVVLLSRMLTTTNIIPSPYTYAVQALGATGIIAYHAEALIGIVLSAIRTTDSEPQTRYLFTLEKNVERLKEMSFGKYVSEVEKLTPEQKKLTGIKTYADAYSAIAEVKVEEVKQPTTAISAEHAVVPQKKRFCQTWCSWFSGNKYQPDDDNANPYQQLSPNIP